MRCVRLHDDSGKDDLKEDEASFLDHLKLDSGHKATCGTDDNHIRQLINVQL